MLTPGLLRGKKIRLTAVSTEDTPSLASWWADADFLRHYDSFPAGPQSEAQLAKRIEDGQSEDTSFLFAIRPIAGDQLFGLLELDGIQWSNGTTFLSIGIGEAENRRKGYGREAIQIALRFAFHELNLHRVCLTTFSYNSAAISLYEGLGFTREGVYREHLQRDGRRYDMYLYGILRPEWEEGVGLSEN